MMNNDKYRKMNRPGGLFDDFDRNMDKDQIKALKKYNQNPNTELTFYEYIWISDKEDMISSFKEKQYNFNYYDEVGKALQKFAENKELNIMEQILVVMSGNEEVNTTYPSMKEHKKYEHFWNTIDRWINITDNGHFS